ncbi:hypothetical protein [Leuconostoc gasicomitatum]|uniref:hypothetical protein n=1 Tax=Leuconostoc gasicomitatum TaxID=115778 RepID=UPI001CC7577C|nr:hypothetical protein [Leuconostoc gasicomitatum]MBZ5968876.1 hypothetical protein [Leuconostoc gasicomitatum]
MENKTVPNLFKNIDELSKLISDESSRSYVDQEKIHTMAEAMKCISETIKKLTR